MKVNNFCLRIALALEVESSSISGFVFSIFMLSGYTTGIHRPVYGLKSSASSRDIPHMPRQEGERRCWTLATIGLVPRGSVCVRVVFLFILDVLLVDVPAGVTQDEGHAGLLIHLPSAVLALIFLARRI